MVVRDEDSYQLVFFVLVCVQFRDLGYVEMRIIWLLDKFKILGCKGVVLDFDYLCLVSFEGFFFRIG